MAGPDGGGTGASCVTRRAYFADTDAGGVVHHSTYLRWLEQARTEWFHDRGESLRKWVDKGLLFVVHKIDISFLAPVLLDDEVAVHAELGKTRQTSATFEQKVVANGKDACEAQVLLVCVDTRTGRPCRIPGGLLS